MSKREKLQANYDAIELAFRLERENRRATEAEQEILRKYSGFGSLKFILNPCEQDEDIEKWSKGDRPFFQPTRELYAMLRSNAKDDHEYRLLSSSVKRSVLTSFYTPSVIVNVIIRYFKDKGVDVKNFLDPSSGTGAFIDSFREEYGEVPEVTAFEKDLLTGKVLKVLHPDSMVIVDGFEKMPLAQKGHYDLVSSNIPFGDISVFDPDFARGGNPNRLAAAKSIHNYFFLKALDAAREGGFVAFITSRGFMDSPSSNPIREEIAKNAALIAALRLPDGMFSEEAGTDVGSDLIILQKHSDYDYEADPETLAFTTTSISDEDMEEEHRGLSMNSYWWQQYFMEDPFIGKLSKGKDPYGKPAPVVTFEGTSSDIAAELQRSLRNSYPLDKSFVHYYNEHSAQQQVLQSQQTMRQGQAEAAPVTRLSSSTLGQSQPVQLSLFDLWEQPSQQQVQQAESAAPVIKERPFNGNILSHYRDGMFVEDGGQLGMLNHIETLPTFTPATLSEKETSILQLYIKVRDAYEVLYRTEADERVEHPELREQLNYEYDNFVTTYGILNGKAVNKTICMDGAGVDMLSLENNVDGQFVKSDIFTHPVAFSVNSIDHVDTAHEALSLSLNKNGDVDLDYMAGLTGQSVEQLAKELKGRIFYNPETGSYDYSDKFLAGNVIQKRDRLREYVDRYPGDERIRESLEAMENIIPAPITFEELDFNLGERWIPAHIYSEFVTWFFGTPATVYYAAAVDDFDISVEDRWASKITTEYAVRGEYKNYDGLTLLHEAFYNTSPTIMKCIGTDANGKDIKAPDLEKIQLANSKIDEMREAFVEFLNGKSREFKDELADSYNRKFNCFVRPSYNGSHLIFGDIDREALAAPKFGIHNIYQSQKDCVWMLLQNGGGICDHEVGTGKTLIMCMAAHEMHRLGVAHKPMIIGLKANVKEIAATYQAAYPNDKILYASERDYSPANRKAFFNKMKNNDYACVIMSHDQFGKIPQSLDIQRDITREEIYDVVEALEVLRASGGKVSKRMLSGLEKRKENLRVKMANTMEAIRKRTDDMVDFSQLGIDHIFVDESHQFKNLEFTTRHDNVAGLGNTRGSTKALNLLYAIRTIQRRTGRDLGATFLSGTTISNSLTELYLLFKYLRPQALEAQNVGCFDAWAAIYTKKTRDYEFSVTNSVILKERFRYFIKVPELAMFYNEITDYRTGDSVGIDRPDMNVLFHNIKPTADQQDFNRRLTEFAKTGDGKLIYRPDLTDREMKGKMLIATDASRKASLDMRLVGDQFGDDPDNKASHCARLVAEYYKKYDEHRGTQFVFSDLSTYKPGEWNIFSEIKRKLVEDYGIPADEIRFIQECKNEKQRDAIIKKMNAGEIRVLFGSTSMLGTGVNAQERAVAVHHLDIPWRPSDLEQRNGRARRKGNEVAKLYASNQVDIIIYAVERTLDNYKFSLLHNKQTFITQLKTNTLGSRTIDEGSMDESGGMNFSEYVAILSGNTDLLEKAKLEKQIITLESERKGFQQQRREVEQRLGRLQEDIKKNGTIITNMSQDYARFESWQQRMQAEGRDGGSGVVLFPVHVNQTGNVIPSPTTDEGLGARLQELVVKERKSPTLGEWRSIGTAFNPSKDADDLSQAFPVVVQTTTKEDGVLTMTDTRFAVKGHYTYEYNNGRIAMQDKMAAALSFRKAMEKIPSYIEQYERRVATDKQQAEEYTRIVSKEWQKEDLLKELKDQLRELDRRIQATLDESKDPSLAEATVKPPYKIDKSGRTHDVIIDCQQVPFVSADDVRRYAYSRRGYVHQHDGELGGSFRTHADAEWFGQLVVQINEGRKNNSELLLTMANERPVTSVVQAARARLKELGIDWVTGKAVVEVEHISPEVRSSRQHNEEEVKVTATTRQGITVYSGKSYEGEARILAHQAKRGYAPAVSEVAKLLSGILFSLPDARNKYVLVPMPDHNGMAGYTLSIAEQAASGQIPVLDILRCDAHEPLYDYKVREGISNMPTLRFWLDGKVPEGCTPIIIDNVLDTGTTVASARKAFPASADVRFAVYSNTDRWKLFNTGINIVMAQQLYAQRQRYLKEQRAAAQETVARATSYIRENYGGSAEQREKIIRDITNACINPFESIRQKVREELARIGIDWQTEKLTDILTPTAGALADLIGREPKASTPSVEPWHALTLAEIGSFTLEQSRERLAHNEEYAKLPLTNYERQDLSADNARLHYHIFDLKQRMAQEGNSAVVESISGEVREAIMHLKDVIDKFGRTSYGSVGKTKKNVYSSEMRIFNAAYNEMEVKDQAYDDARTGYKRFFFRDDEDGRVWRFSVQRPRYKGENYSNFNYTVLGGRSDDLDLMRGEQKPVSHEDAILRDRLIAIMRGAGIPVTSSTEVGQGVLDDYRRNHGEIKAQRKLDDPIFVSNALLAIDGISQTKATPAQWFRMIDKNGGIKAGEDKWTGLSDWLKNSQERILTKQQVLEYIAGNQIQIEEVHYKENSSSQYFSPKLDQMNEEFFILMDEAEEATGSIYLVDHARWAFEQMVERYGNDFRLATEYVRHDELGWQLRPFEYYEGAGPNSRSAEYYGLERGINSTRLDYTTRGLYNKREIALTVPAIEPWAEDDSIHFGDAGHGRAVAWVRFGDTTGQRELVEEEIQKNIQAMPSSDKWQEVTNYKDLVPGYRNYFNLTRGSLSNADCILEKDGVFHIEFGDYSSIVPMNVNDEKYSAALKRIDETFTSLQDAVAAYNEFIARRNRFTDERVLVIDEIQSKRHQEGREKGYYSPADIRNMRKELRNLESNQDSLFYDLPDEIKESRRNKIQYLNSTDAPEGMRERYYEIEKRRNDLIKQIDSAMTGKLIPAAPFEKNWHELAMKRMLRYAAENGYDRVAWTTGNQQADRYDLGEHIDFVTAEPYEAQSPGEVSGFDVTLQTRGMASVDLFVTSDGIIQSGGYGEDANYFAGQPLYKFVGKGLSDKILAVQDWERFDGEDLRLGADGMKGFYDGILVNFMDKYGKQWGVHTEDVELNELHIEGKLHSVAVVPQMKEDVRKGQPMFFRDSRGVVYGFAVGGEVYIDEMMSTSETPIHEYTHLWAEVLRHRNPKEWENIVGMMKSDEVLWKKVVANYPNLSGDDKIAEEVLAHYSGRRGYERLMEEMRGEANADSIIAKMMQVLGRFWKNIAEFFNIHYTSKEQVADRVLYDLLSGLNPMDYKETADTDLRAHFIGERGVINLDVAYDGMNTSFLHHAEKMEGLGLSAETVKETTGWERGADGKWRFEIVSPAFHDIDAIHQQELAAIMASYNEVEAQLESTNNLIDNITERIPTWRSFIGLPASQSKAITEIMSKRDMLLERSKELRTRLMQMAETRNNGITIPLTHLISENNSIIKAYPELASTKVLFSNEQGGEAARGSYSSSLNLITVNNAASVATKRDIIIHELQHAVQVFEGFAQGGNERAINDSLKLNQDFDKYVDARLATNDMLERRYQLPFTERKIERAFNNADLIYKREWYRDLLRQLGTGELTLDDVNTYARGSYARYHSLAGEVEARNAVSRSKMSGEERRHTLASATEDVPRDRQEVVYASEDASLLFREVEYFEDGTILPVSQDNRVSILLDSYPSKLQLIEAVRTQYPAYCAEWVEGQQGIKLTAWSSIMPARQLSPRQERQRSVRIQRGIDRAVTVIQEAAGKLHLTVDVLTSAEGLAGRKAMSKGWFDKETGKIVLVLPNHSGREDAMHTLLHEGVAHYGLRELFGNHFDTFLDNVYEAAAPEVRARIDAAISHNGWDRHTATEEYLARLAESTDFERATQSGWWTKIKQFFLEMLTTAGFRENSKISLTDSDLRFILWRSYENLVMPGRYRSVEGTAQTVAMTPPTSSVPPQETEEQTFAVAAELKPIKPATLDDDAVLTAVHHLAAEGLLGDVELEDIENLYQLTDEYVDHWIEHKQRTDPDFYDYIVEKLGQGDESVLSRVLKGEVVENAEFLLLDVGKESHNEKEFVEKVRGVIGTFERTAQDYPALHAYWFVLNDLINIAKPTPPRQQSIQSRSFTDRYERLKHDYPNTTILFAVGGVYQAVGDDADKVARILGNRVERGVTVIPNLDIALPKLIRAGVRVAVADEVVQKPENVSTETGNSLTMQPNDTEDISERLKGLTESVSDRDVSYLNRLISTKEQEIDFIRRSIPLEQEYYDEWQQSIDTGAEEEKRDRYFKYAEEHEQEMMELDAVRQEIEELRQEVEEKSVLHRLRTKPAPEVTGKAYKVFYLKDGQLYSPMVANPDGKATSVGVWLDADAAPVAAVSSTGRQKVKAGGKGTQGGSGQLAYRPGWHLGTIPYALQFNRGEMIDNPLGITNKKGEPLKVRKFFPKDFVWAEVEYPAGKDYQSEAMSYGYNERGNFEHALAGLPRVPEDGSYRYRTNPNPATDEWVITGAMRVNRILSRVEVSEMVLAAGREPQPIEDGDILTQEVVDTINGNIKSIREADDMGLLYRMTDAEERRMSFARGEVIHIDDLDFASEYLETEEHQSSYDNRVGYSVTVSDYGQDDKAEHMEQSIFYEGQMIGFRYAYSEKNTDGESLTFDESFHIDLPVSSYDEHPEAWCEVDGMKPSVLLDTATLRFRNERDMVEFYQKHRAEIEYRKYRSQRISELGRHNPEAARQMSHDLPVVLGKNVSHLLAQVDVDMAFNKYAGQQHNGQEILTESISAALDRANAEMRRSRERLERANKEMRAEKERSRQRLTMALLELSRSIPSVTVTDEEKELLRIDLELEKADPDRTHEFDCSEVSREMHNAIEDFYNYNLLTLRQRDLINEALKVDNDVLRWYCETVFGYAYERAAGDYIEASHFPTALSREELDTILDVRHNMRPKITGVDSVQRYDEMEKELLAARDGLSEAMAGKRILTERERDIVFADIVFGQKNLTGFAKGKGYTIAQLEKVLSRSASIIEDVAKTSAEANEQRAVQQTVLKPEESKTPKSFYDLKSKHPDAVLLFRTGDFYETYEQDALDVSKILGITLTHRQPTAKVESPENAMAGFPHHALDTYLPKLIRAGKRVAICGPLVETNQKRKAKICELVSPGIANVRMHMVSNMDEVREVLPQEALLRDTLIERLRSAGIRINTDIEEGQRILDQEKSNLSNIVRDGLEMRSDDTIGFSLVESVNKQRAQNNQHFIKNRNQLSNDEKEIQQKAWRTVFHSLSEFVFSSEMPRRTEVPGTSYSASKPNANANLGKLSGIIGQLNVLLREINEKDLSREQFANMLAGSLGLRLDKDKTSRYSDEPITLLNGEKVGLRVSNHPALSVNFVRWKNNDNVSYGFVFRDGSKGRFNDDRRVDYLEIDYNKNSIDDASFWLRRNLYRDIVEGVKFMLEEGSLEMMPFPDLLNASGKFKKPLEQYRKEHPEMMFYVEPKIESIPSRLKLFTDNENVVYGFVHQDTIYIDPRIANAETPIHEYTHLWAEALRSRNLKEWENIVGMMKSDEALWKKVVANYPSLRGDDNIAEEVLAHYSGRRGVERLREFAAGYDNPEGVFAKVSTILDKFWNAVADFLHIHYTSKEEVADRVLYDLLNGVRPLKAIQGLESYDYEDVERLVEIRVKEILEEKFSEEDVYVKEVTVIGSRTRGEARKDSDLDILLEYGGENVREDTMHNVLHEDPFDIEGIPVDILPINEHYSLNTKAWLERDAQWREQDRQKQNDQQKSIIMKQKELNQDVRENITEHFERVQKMVEEHGLSFVPLALRIPVRMDMENPDPAWSNTLISHITFADNGDSVYLSRQDAYDDERAFSFHSLPEKNQHEVLQLVEEMMMNQDQQMTVYVDTKQVPEWALNAIVNGDVTGLTDEEKAMVEEFEAQYPGHILSPRDESPSYNSRPAFGPAADCVAVDIVRTATPRQLRMAVQLKAMEAERTQQDLEIKKTIGQGISPFKGNSDDVNATIKHLLEKDDTFRYQLLSRMQSDVKYFLGNGNRYEPDLWAGNAKDHIVIMDALMQSLPESPKWLSAEMLINYADQMGVGEIYYGPSEKEHIFEQSVGDKRQPMTSSQAEKNSGRWDSPDYSAKEVKQNMEDNIMSNTKDQQALQPEENVAQRPEEKKKVDWSNYDYSRNRFPEGAEVSNISIRKSPPKQGEKYPVWVISADINGEHKEANMWWPDIKAFNETDALGHWTNRVTKEMLAAKYWGLETAKKMGVYLNLQPQAQQSQAPAAPQQEQVEKKTTRWENFDYAKYQFPEGVELLSAEVTQDQNEDNTLSMLNVVVKIDGIATPFKAPLYANNVADYTTGRVTAEVMAPVLVRQQVAKHMGIDVRAFLRDASQTVAAVKREGEKKVEEKTRQEAAVQQQKQKEAQLQQAAIQEKQEANEKDAQEQQQQREREQKEKEQAERRKKVDDAIKLHTALLSGAFLAAIIRSDHQESPVWINEKGLKAPSFVFGSNSQNISPFNSVLMALQAEKMGYLSNAYTTYNGANSQEFNVKRGEKGFPFNLYAWNKYVHKYNAQQEIDRTAYEALSPQEKSLYRLVPQKKMSSIFNVDQTTFPAVKENEYKDFIKEQRASLVEDTTDERELRFKSFQFIKEQHPDSIMIFKVGKNYEIYGNDADVASRILGYPINLESGPESKGFDRVIRMPYFDYAECLTKLQEGGQRVCRIEKYDKPRQQELANVLKAESDLSSLIDGLRQQGDVRVNVETAHSLYDKERGKIDIASRQVVPGKEITGVLEYMSEVYRTVIAYTGDENRLCRAERSHLLPEDAEKYEILVQEVAAGALMARKGLPATLSPKSVELYEYWERELKEDPKMIDALERDVNYAVLTVEKIQRGEKVEYASLQGRRPEVKPDVRQYTIASELSTLANAERKEVVLITDSTKKSASVIIPSGASYDIPNEPEGLSKDALLVAVRNKGYDDIHFYNTGGVNGLHEKNDYFQGKEVSVARLDGFELKPLQLLDYSEEIESSSRIEIKRVAPFLDDNNKWALYVKAADREEFAVQGTEVSNDIARLFSMFKSSTATEEDKMKLREEIGHKYCMLVESDPSIKTDSLMPKVDGVNLSRIGKVSINKDKEGNIKMTATIDGKKVEESKTVEDKYWNRFWLVDDKNGFKIALAAKVFSNELGQTASLTQEQREGLEKIVSEYKSSRQEAKSPAVKSGPRL